MNLEEIFEYYSISNVIELTEDIKQYIINLFNDNIMINDLTNVEYVFWNAVYNTCKSNVADINNIIDSNIVNYDILLSLRLEEYMYNVVYYNNAYILYYICYIIKIKKNYILAIDYLTKIKYMTVCVYYNLGYCCKFIKEYELMKLSYISAIKHNHIKSMLSLADYYSNIEINQKKMLEYLLKASKLNNNEAHYTLGLHYFTLKKYNLSMKYFKLNKNYIIEKSYNYIGLCYYNQKMYDESLQYFEMSAKLNFETAYNNIGNYYNDVKKNLSKAIEYYKKTKNRINAIKHIVYYHFNVDYDYDEGLIYLKKAIKLKISDIIPFVCKNNIEVKNKMIELLLQ